ncbi:uncharacterized protein [Halyomorpha halys]|uniref:uncharacterized protein n=1 Tax=Halyomorpha halys TaxID=286706 RepID=UPI0006D4C91E|nr:Ig-like V-type domain-containing protein FAM187A [Halyomorpha halys]
MILKMLLCFRIICVMANKTTNMTNLDIHLDLLSKLNTYLLLTREEPVDEYPVNTTHNRKIWDRYYLCLQKQYEAIGEKEVLVPEAISILEGENVHMECRVCLFPGDDIGTAEWYWYTMLVPMDEWTVKDHKGRLSIYGVRLEEAGLYECRIGSTRSRPYFLHVAPDSEPVSEVKPYTAKKGPYPALPKVTASVFNVFTNWNPWTDCTRCDHVGRKYRFGACTVSLREPGNMMTTALEETPDLEILQLFAQGLPCWSPLLPRIVRHNRDVRNRSNEMMLAFCKVPCADDIFEVRTVLGKLLERVNNSAGLFSTLQGPPPLPPLPGRLTVYAQIGNPLSLSCPGHNLCDLPYRWGIGRKAKIAPWIAESKSLGRVTVNAKQQLVFNSIQPDDEKLYSCWQGESLAGVVRLLVFDERKVPVNHHLIIFGTLLILGTFLYVFVRIYMNRKRAASVYY